MENSSNNFILREKVAGIVIWYNPTLDDVENIKSYLPFIDYLYIFDNTQEGNNCHLLKNLNKNNLKYLSLNENKGIPFALNYIANESYLKNYRWLLTMDQDSYFFKDTFKKYFLENNIFNLNDVGILSPNYYYKNKKLEKSTKIEELEFVITSGNLINLNIWKKIGGFNEKLFIDEVDHEYCYRLKKKGFKILKYGEVVLNHSLGTSCEKNILGKKIKYIEHNEIRKYYIFRNSLYIMKLYPEYKKIYIKKILKEIFKILFLEKNKSIKLKNIILGLKDYKKM